MSYNYDYKEEVKNDVIDYINENWKTEEIKKEFSSVEEFEEKLNDDCWISDSVTGNASGSYFCNSYKSMEYVTDNMELLEEMCNNFGIDDAEIGRKFLKGNWEWMDVSIRCYVLGSAISDALEELEIDDDFFEEEEEEEEEGETI